MRLTAASERAFAEARRVMPGGVSSPVRAYGKVGGCPPFIREGRGAHIIDIDGNEYLDFVLSWGPLVCGHAHPDVVAAVTAAARRGTSYGAPTLAETALVHAVQRLYPSMELMRFVSSGTEATMSALRLARGFTGRRHIVKFIGCYHGHSDGLLVKAGSGLATQGTPDSAGVPPEIAALTITVPYNDLDAVAALDWRDLAAVIVEPVTGNMGTVLPRPGFLAGLRELTAKHGALLIFDEVMCGFRAALNGAQGFWGLTPDLTCLGKIIGGGLPVAAYGGREDIMRRVAPDGCVYQAGTLSGNPLAMAAGLATLGLLTRPGYYDAMLARTTRLCDGLRALASTRGVPLQVNQAGTMFSLFFADHAVTDYASAAHGNEAAFRAWFWAMLDAGIYLAPSPYETLFMSGAHTDADIDKTLSAADNALLTVRTTLSTEEGQP